MEVESLIITEEMKKEEENLKEQNLSEENELKKEIQSKDEAEQEISEQRYKRLMHLLTKSQFYSDYLLTKIKEQKDRESSKMKKKKLKPNAKEGKENSGNASSEKISSQEINSQKRAKRSKKTLCEIDEKDVAKNMNFLEETVEGKPSVRELQPILFENGEMRTYQLDGFTWLKTLFENGINGILADEMGLGKTIQCIALICHLIYMGIPGPFLVVGPLSTLPNWISEFCRFAPKVPVLLYHGNASVRKQKWQLIDRKIKIADYEHNCCPVVITSYEIAIKDSKILKKYFWRYLIVDEGQRLKNYKCILFKALCGLSTRTRLILTGTPLQNNLKELWALLNFLLPDIFDNLDVFESWFEIDEMMEEGSEEKIIQQEREKQIVSTLHKILSPFLLRRVKADVDFQIPPKKELIVHVPLTSMQLKLYEAMIKRDYSSIVHYGEGITKTSEVTSTLCSSGRMKRERKQKRNLSQLLNDADTDEGLETYLQEATKVTHIDNPMRGSEVRTCEMNFTMKNIMMQTRKIVNHPYLIRYPLKEGEYKVDEDLLKNSGKLQVLDQILEELRNRGHKVLLFSQMTKMLDIIEDYLSLKPIFKYRRLDGRVNLDDRRRFIDEFNNDNEYFLFLISTRAGGLGINLTSADTVIIYDSDWNPQQDLQAQDRCHRIGQTKPVLVLRLVAASTIDQRMVERASKKRNLEKMIIKSGKFKEYNYEERNMDENVDPDELLALLQSRDHDRIHRTSTGKGVFTKKELNQLLDRSDLVKNSGGKLELKGVFATISK